MYSLYTCETHHRVGTGHMFCVESVEQERDALAAQLAESQERAQVLEAALRTLLADLKGAGRNGYWADGCLYKAQEVLDSFEDGT